ncbi:MAG: LytTR family DNA-binding domain-containing protein [Pseudomonadota bacterium]
MQGMQRFDPRTSWEGFRLTAGLILIVFFVLLNPEPSQQLSPLGASLFWALHVAIPLVLAQALQLVLSAAWRGASERPWVVVGFAGIGAALAFAPAALLLDRVLFDGDDGFSFSAVASEAGALVPLVTAVWMGLNAARLFRFEAPENSRATNDAPVHPFLDRVPVAKRGALIALSAELHYLRVYTTLGDSLILYAFGQAMRDLQGARGLQVHRSHWVDPQFVETVEQSGGTAQVKLTNGVTVPIARSRRQSVLNRLNA